jgi:hypothetical protein
MSSTKDSFTGNSVEKSNIWGYGKVNCDSAVVLAEQKSREYQPTKISSKTNLSNVTISDNNLSISNTNSKQMKLNIYNIKGQIVKSVSLTDNITVSLSTLSSGWYFYKLKEMQKVTNSGHFFISK